jgi:hypothetical protein
MFMSQESCRPHEQGLQVYNLISKANPEIEKATFAPQLLNKQGSKNTLSLGPGAWWNNSYLHQLRQTSSISNFMSACVSRLKLI